MKSTGIFQALVAASVPLVAVADNIDPKLANCPGYKASNVKTTCAGLTASLELAGPACNAYGKDLQNLTLQVKVETGKFDYLL